MKELLGHLIAGLIVFFQKYADISQVSVCIYVYIYIESLLLSLFSCRLHMCTFDRP